MDAVLAAIARRRDEIDSHPLYTWMAGGTVPLEVVALFGTAVALKLALRQARAGLSELRRPDQPL